jgi:cytochrome c-type biogenesis protein CcmF
VIAELGLALLWLAAALALLQLLLGVLGLCTHRADFTQGMNAVAALQGLLTALAFLLLVMAFLNSDMSVKLVATNSHSAKPWLYKLSGTWGNHEGSMLLWVMILALSGALIGLFERRISPEMKAATLAAQAAISIGFYAFLLFSSNPFERLIPAAKEGAGLNPVLQDPGLAFHPPTLYIGYVGLSVAFSFAVGALVTQQVNAAFARAMRPWVLGAWIFLTLGITAGSYWAYYELGWGGWWFWDPVENASLMPWLAATALLHSVTVLATRDSLRAWTVMLAVVAFSMSMLGTFLVRSGILTSVHAFAVDPERGSFILALLAIYIGGALALFALRIGAVREGAQFDLVSRESALVINNLLLSVILGLVLIGTLYPLFLQSFGKTVSVGPPYFNATAGSITLALVVFMAAGPVMRWRRDDWRQVTRRLWLPAVLTLLVLVTVIVTLPGMSILPMLGLVLAIGVGTASVAPLWKRNLRRTPLFTYGMVVAHLGVAVSMAGMAADSAFMQERLVALPEGGRTNVGPFSVKIAKIEPIVGPNWTALQATLDTKRSSGDTATLTPQARTFTSPITQTSEAAISTRWDGQLYAALGQGTPDGRWQLRLWWKPFVTLIWGGGILIALGGLLALIGRLRRAAVADYRKGWG